MLHRLTTRFGFSQGRIRLGMWSGMLLTMLLVSTPLLWAGTYTDSAHGSNDDGVYRTNIGSAPPVGFGYARGNCAHCHEQHASIAGSEPDPVTGPAAYAIFAPNFDTAVQTNPYAEGDNFCFYCHNGSGSAQQVTNYDYSRNFGCGTLGPTSILGAVNQLSYHNLYDIWVFAGNKYSSWFKGQNNPCAACHNPHLARRNWANPQDTSFAAISRPGDHFNLWGTTETMAASYTTRYEPPYCAGTFTDREPAGSADAATGRANTPDYVAFCTECHNTTDTIASTTLGTNIRPIDWSAGGDKHGLRDMDGGLDIRGPYGSAGDYVLSCMDCHEPHGSENVMLVRSRVNGEDLGTTIASFNGIAWGYLCRRCHEDDLSNSSSADTDTENAWEYVHHLAPDAPFNQSMCRSCHSGPQQQPINCDDCHYHGANISVTAGGGGSRRAF
jgi:hypothetical protein